MFVVHNYGVMLLAIDVLFDMRNCYESSLTKYDLPCFNGKNFAQILMILGKCRE